LVDPPDAAGRADGVTVEEEGVYREESFSETEELEVFTATTGEFPADDTGDTEDCTGFKGGGTSIFWKDSGIFERHRGHFEALPLIVNPHLGHFMSIHPLGNNQHKGQLPR